MGYIIPKRVAVEDILMSNDQEVILPKDMCLLVYLSGTMENTLMPDLDKELVYCCGPRVGSAQ